jgi:hypothetical protein
MVTATVVNFRSKLAVQFVEKGVLLRLIQDDAILRVEVKPKIFC